MALSSNGIRIVSTTADGTQGNGASGGIGGSSGGYDNSNSFSISADGTKVAFNSDASNLVPGDTNGYTDVFVKDLVTGAITLASTLTGSDVGRSLQPTLSPDGTKVAFATTPFVNGAPFGPAQVFIKDLITGTVTLAVTDSNGAKLVRDVVASPVFSPDGKKLAFYSTFDLTGAGTGKAGGLYVKDLNSRVATLVSANTAGKPGNGYSSEPVFSSDGTKIAFVSASTNLGQTPKLGTSNDVYVKDLVTGAVTLVSANALGQRGSTLYNTFVDSTNPTFSPDGSKVAFQSSANNLVPGDQDNGDDVFIKDLATGAVTRVTALADGTSEGGYGPAFSPDGTKIAFWSFATGYSPFPHAQGSSIYIKDLITGAFTLVSAPVNPANPGVGNNQDPQFSPNGREILFWGSNEALVATDANGNTADIFLKALSAPLAPPTAVADSYTTAQGTPLTVGAPAGLLANDTDTDGKPLTALLVGNPAHGALTLNSDGSFTYTPALGYSGSDSFTYKAVDGTVQSTTATVSLTVTAVNHPVISADDSYAVSNAFPSADFLVGAATGLLANDTAPDGGLVALGIVAGGTVQTGTVNTAAGGRATVFSDGRFLYDQPFSISADDQSVIRYNGLDSFVYRVRDADGSTADATVTLTVGSGVNHPVTAVDDSYAVSNASPSDDFLVNAATGLLANDTAPDGGLVALGIVVNGTVQTGTVSTAAGGRATVFSDGRFLYDQPFSFDDQSVVRYNGVDSFVYRVRDADGSTANATVTLTVGSGVNHPVTAVDDSYAVSNASPSDDFLVNAATGLLANDTAPDGGLVALGIVVNGTVQTGAVRTAAGGRATVLSDGRLVYDQPFSSDPQGVVRYNGPDSFVYRVRDADGSTADATVTLTVGSGVNHPVTAAGDSYMVANTLPAPYFTTSIATGLLANDTAPDGGLVALGAVVNGVVQTGSVRTAAGGSVTVLPNGTFTYYQPYSVDDQGVIFYNGIDCFTYRVRDANGSTADATVTLTVGTPIAPVEMTIGDGPDDLVLYTSENAYRGDAQYTVSVDGQQIGGVQTTTVAHGAGPSQLLHVRGALGATLHTVTIDFLNDAYDDTVTTDRNLYVDHATINGTTIEDSTLALFSGGPQSFHFGSLASPSTIGAGRDTLDLLLSEDAYLGDAELTVSVDGREIGGVLSVTASHVMGQNQILHILGTFGASPHTVSVNFLNDAYDGTATTDRNIYVDHATINGTTIGDSTMTLFVNGPQSFHFGGPAAPTTIGAGSDTLDLLLSEDAYLGDPQFTVSVDGYQIGGLLSASASHAMGQDQILHVLGTFGASPHTVSVNFLNDAYDGTATTDRNLYVDGATINGNAVAGSNLAFYAGGSQSFTFTSHML